MCIQTWPFLTSVFYVKFSCWEVELWTAQTANIVEEPGPYASSTKLCLIGGDMRIKLISIIIGFVDKTAQDSVKARKNGSSSFV